MKDETNFQKQVIPECDAYVCLKLKIHLTHLRVFIGNTPTGVYEQLLC